MDCRRGPGVLGQPGTGEALLPKSKQEATQDGAGGKGTCCRANLVDLNSIAESSIGGRKEPAACTLSTDLHVEAPSHRHGCTLNRNEQIYKWGEGGKRFTVKSLLSGTHIKRWAWSGSVPQDHPGRGARLAGLLVSSRCSGRPCLKRVSHLTSLLWPPPLCWHCPTSRQTTGGSQGSCKNTLLQVCLGLKRLG